MYVSPTLAVLPPYKAGRVRLLAVSSPERLAAAPEIPTLVEKGLAFVRFGWLGSSCLLARKAIQSRSRQAIAAIRASL